MAPLASGHQCTYTGAKYVLNNLFVLCIVGNSLLLGNLAGATVIDTPWLQGPVISSSGAVVVHRVNKCTFIVSSRTPP